MAKYCGNCGAQLPDSARICGQCGTPLNGASGSARGMNVGAPGKQQKTTKMVKWIVALVAFVIVAVIAISVVTQYTGRNGLVRKVMNAYKDYDVDTLMNLSSEVYFYRFDDWYHDDDWAEEYFKSAVGNDLDYFDSSVGHNYKISYEVNEIYTLSERKYEDMIERIEGTFYDFDTEIIEEIAVADVTVTAKQGKRSDDLDIEITLSKEDGSWRLLGIE